MRRYAIRNYKGQWYRYHGPDIEWVTDPAQASHWLITPGHIDQVGPMVHMLCDSLLTRGITMGEVVILNDDGSVPLTFQSRFI